MGERPARSECICACNIHEYIAPRNNNNMGVNKFVCVCLAVYIHLYIFLIDLMYNFFFFFCLKKHNTMIMCREKESKKEREREVQSLGCFSLLPMPVFMPSTRSSSGVKKDQSNCCSSQGRFQHLQKKFVHGNSRITTNESPEPSQRTIYLPDARHAQQQVLHLLAGSIPLSIE